MATKPATEAPGLPSAEDLDKVAAEEKVIDVTATPVPNSEQQKKLAQANNGVNSREAKNTTAIDSVGKPKDGGKVTPIGGRGPTAPRDSKPAPGQAEKRAAQTKITVTDNVDNAGNAKAGPSVDHHVGIRGTHTSRDTYKL